jgi:hypothetical protein
MKNTENGNDQENPPAVEVDKLMTSTVKTLVEAAFDFVYYSRDKSERGDSLVAVIYDGTHDTGSDIRKRMTAAAHDFLAEAAQAVEMALLNPSREVLSTPIQTEAQQSVRHEMFELCRPVKDVFTGLTGVLTHYVINSSGHADYVMQPVGINVKTGHPVDRIYITANRVEGGIVVPEPKLVIREALGSVVRDTASGIEGHVESIIVHPGGCCHLRIIPRGSDQHGNQIASYEIDIHRAEGTHIPKWTEEEVKADQERHPSPDPLPGCPTCCDSQPVWPKN